jgi:aryl-alcohol dehydrogenase-like predicted oxidoreductase
VARDLEAPESVVSTCRELGIGIVPYSPVAREFLSGQFTDAAPGKGDFQATMPYLRKENRAHNVAVRERVKAIGEAKGLTLSQLSLAWVQCHGVDMVPIPGTTSLAHLEENALASTVDADAVIANIRSIHTQIIQFEPTSIPRAPQFVRTMVLQRLQRLHPHRCSRGATSRRAGGRELHGANL